MPTYSVTLYPIPEATVSEIAKVLAKIQTLPGSIPGLESVKIDGFVTNTRQETYSYTMQFASQEQLGSYNTQPAYQEVHEELLRLCPKAVVSSITLISHSIRIIEHPERDE